MNKCQDLTILIKNVVECDAEMVKALLIVTNMRRSVVVVVVLLLLLVFSLLLLQCRLVFSCWIVKNMSNWLLNSELEQSKVFLCHYTLSSCSDLLIYKPKTKQILVSRKKWRLKRHKKLSYKNLSVFIPVHSLQDATK